MARWRVANLLLMSQPGGFTPLLGAKSSWIDCMIVATTTHCFSSQWSMSETVSPDTRNRSKSSRNTTDFGRSLTGDVRTSRSRSASLGKNRGAWAQSRRSTSTTRRVLPAIEGPTTSRGCRRCSPSRTAVSRSRGANVVTSRSDLCTRNDVRSRSRIVPTAPARSVKRRAVLRRSTHVRTAGVKFTAAPASSPTTPQIAGHGKSAPETQGTTAPTRASTAGGTAHHSDVPGSSVTMALRPTVGPPNRRTSGLTAASLADILCHTWV